MRLISVARQAPDALTGAATVEFLLVLFLILVLPGFLRFERRQVEAASVRMGTSFVFGPPLPICGYGLLNEPYFFTITGVPRSTA
jgi:hypothetical protein